MACSSLLSDDDLQRFRTKPCQRLKTCKGCDFGESRCQYSHNGYWNRRSPFHVNSNTNLRVNSNGNLRYTSRFCPDIRLCDTTSQIEQNKCTRGGGCPFAHSDEERLYHPLFYKTEPCDEYHEGGCATYYCPFVHGLAEKREKKLYSLPYVDPELKADLLEENIIVVKTRKQDNRRTRSNHIYTTSKQAIPNGAENGDAPSCSTRSTSAATQGGPSGQQTRRMLLSGGGGRASAACGGRMAVGGTSSSLCPLHIPRNARSDRSESETGKPTSLKMGPNDDKLSRRPRVSTPASPPNFQPRQAHLGKCQHQRDQKLTTHLRNIKSNSCRSHNTNDATRNQSEDDSNSVTDGKASPTNNASRALASLQLMPTRANAHTAGGSDDPYQDTPAFFNNQISNLIEMLEDPNLLHRFTSQDWMGVNAAVHRLSGSVLNGQRQSAIVSTAMPLSTNCSNTNGGAAGPSHRLDGTQPHHTNNPHNSLTLREPLRGGGDSKWLFHDAHDSCVQQSEQLDDGVVGLNTPSRDPASSGAYPPTRCDRFCLQGDEEFVYGGSSIALTSSPVNTLSSDTTPAAQATPADYGRRQWPLNTPPESIYLDQFGDAISLEQSTVDSLNAAANSSLINTDSSLHDLSPWHGPGYCCTATPDTANSSNICSPSNAAATHLANQLDDGSAQARHHAHTQHTLAALSNYQALALRMGGSRDLLETSDSLRHTQSMLGINLHNGVGQGGVSTSCPTLGSPPIQDRDERGLLTDPNLGGSCKVPSQQNMTPTEEANEAPLSLPLEPSYPDSGTSQLLKDGLTLDGEEPQSQASPNCGAPPGLPDLKWLMGVTRSHTTDVLAPFGGRHLYLKENPLRRQFGCSNTMGGTNSEHNGSSMNPSTNTNSEATWHRNLT